MAEDQSPAVNHTAAGEVKTVEASANTSDLISREQQITEDAKLAENVAKAAVEGRSKSLRRSGAGGKSAADRAREELLASFKFDQIVWAKVGRFCHWPGKITDPNTEGVQEQLLKLAKPGQFLVLFFGSYDCAWVNPNHLVDFKEGYDSLVKKSKSKLFKFAIEEAEKYLKEGIVPEGFNMLAEDEIEEEEQPPDLEK